MAKKKVTNRLQQIGGTPSRSTPPSMPGRASETQLVELGMFISATILGTLIIAVLAIVFGIKAIENRLETQATGIINREVSAVSEDDPTVPVRTDISVEASGTSLHLRGTVGFEEHREALQPLIESIEGVGAVTIELQYLPAVDIATPDVVAAPISITWSNRSATIVGEISDQANLDAFVGALEAAFPGGVDAEQFLVKEGAPSERDWLSSILGIVEIGGETLPEGRILVNAAERLVQVSGQYETRQERRDAQEDVEALVAGTTFDFISGLAIPEPPAFTREDVEDLQESIDDLIEGKVVEFELNSDVLTPVGVGLLGDILAALEQFPNVPIEIGGHTDSQGDDAENLDLSERRAQAALDYLVANGQDVARFVVEGYGEDVPVASNSTAEGRARNRRIEFKALEE